MAKINALAFFVFAMACCILDTAWAARVGGRRLTYYECKLPHGADQYSVITKEDAGIGAHNMYKGMAIGGTLYDETPTENGTVDHSISYIKHLDSKSNFNFNGGLITGQTVPDSMIAHFEWLAQNAKSSSTHDGKRVFVLTKGGTYNLYDFVPNGQGEDNGNTVVIFNTSEDIYITKTHDGRQFGPSIIAPFAKVFILGDAGYVDGFIMAKKVWTTGYNQGQLQLHGDTYRGTFVCHDYPTPTPPYYPPPVHPPPVHPPPVHPPPVHPPPVHPPPVHPPPVHPPPVHPPTHSPPTCIAKWGDCTKNQHGCCHGLTCHVQNPYYSQCLEPPPTCIAKYGDCTGKPHSCCHPYMCRVQNPYYSQCLHPY